MNVSYAKIIICLEEAVHMKKICAIFAGGVILFTSCFAAFTDMDDSHWAYSAVTRMEEAEILSGYEDGSFKPSNNITLAEFATIFTKVFEIQKNNDDDYFTSIPMDHWAKGCVEAVREFINPHYDSIGEALGITDYSYLPGLPGDIEMTREAFIYAVSRIYGYSESLYKDGEEKILFADFDEILYPKEVVMAYKNKIISGEVIDGKVYIRPNRCITRAEASSIFRNLLKYEENSVNNKNEESQLNAAFSNFVKILKTLDMESVKNCIYDTKGVLKNENFILNDSQEELINELLEISMKDFDYEVLERGFYCFNRGYIKVKINCYDIFDDIESLQNITEEEIADLKKALDKKKIKTVEREEIFNFAKLDGEWKLILK